MKRYVLLAVALSVASLSAEQATVLQTLLPAGIADELAEKGLVQNTLYGKTGDGLKLSPALPIVASSKELVPFPDATYLSETLYLYKKKTPTVPGADIPKISAILRSISHLQGLEYFSNSRQKMWVLYEKSYVIDNKKTKKKIADPVSGDANGKTILAVQKDTTFGEYLYEYTYRQNTDSVAFFSRNLETMRYTLIKIIDSERLRTSLIVHDLGDSLLVYGVTYADLAYVPAIGNKLNASFTARAEALYTWFVKEYER